MNVIYPGGHQLHRPGRGVLGGRTDEIMREAVYAAGGAILAERYFRSDCCDSVIEQ